MAGDFISRTPGTPATYESVPFASNRIVAYAGTLDGVANNAQLRSPRGIALDPTNGSLVFAVSAGKLRRLSANGVVSTVPQSECPGHLYCSADGVAVSPSGVILTNLWGGITVQANATYSGLSWSGISRQLNGGP